MFSYERFLLDKLAVLISESTLLNCNCAVKNCLKISLSSNKASVLI